MLLAPVGEELRAARRAAGLTIDQLAVRAGVSGATVERIEHGRVKPHPKTLRALALVLPAAPAGQSPCAQVGRDGLAANATAALEAVRAGAGAWVAISDIATATGLSASTLRNHLPALVERGLIEATGETKQRHYRAVLPDNGRSGSGMAPATPKKAPKHPTAVARARILDHLSRRALDEQSLTAHLGLDREVVAYICGDLLLNDALRLRPDGRYEVIA